MSKRILGLSATGSSLLLLGLLLASCCRDQAVSIGMPSQQPPPMQTAESAVALVQPVTGESAMPEEQSVALPMQIGEGQTRLKAGQAVTVRLWLVEGKRQHDAEPNLIPGDYLTGNFELTAEDEAGVEFARIRVNEAFQNEEMAFSEGKPIRLLFADYNGDGAMDVSIGQPAGSNGSFYALFSIDSDGFRILETDLYSADRRYSIRYPQAQDGALINTYYDQAAGSYMEVRRTWENNAFVRSEPVAAKARLAGEDED